MRSRLAGIGSYARPTTPEEATKFIQEEQRTWAPLLERLAANP